MDRGRPAPAGFPRVWPKGRELDLARSTTTRRRRGGVIERVMGALARKASVAYVAVEIGKSGPHPGDSGRGIPKGYARVDAVPSTRTW